METVWMGNYYDYRAAFFSDVMYSNNVPGKEGALLYRDPARALQMALLYQVLENRAFHETSLTSPRVCQRYKRFDQASYATQNATFYNVFAADAVRVGRYKVPQVSLFASFACPRVPRPGLTLTWPCRATASWSCASPTR